MLKYYMKHINNIKLPLLRHRSPSASGSVSAARFLGACVALQVALSTRKGHAFSAFGAAGVCIEPVLGASRFNG